MLGFKQFIEANSPEFNRRAEIISGLDNLVFNINDENKNKVLIALYDLNRFHKVNDAVYDSYGTDHMKNIAKKVEEKTAVDESEVGTGSLEMKDNPAHLHIGVDPYLRGQGIGGMIYEIAMEYATAHGKALMITGPHQGYAASKQAYKVWDNFYNNRQNVTPIPLIKYSGNDKLDKIIAQKILYGHVDTGNRFDYKQPLTPEVMQELKEKYPAAFNAFKRDQYTIPQLERAGKLLRMHNTGELYKYFSGLVGERPETSSRAW